MIQEKKRELNFQEVWEELRPDQLIYVNFFRRWGCIFCKAGAMELNKTFDKVNEEFPGKLKFIGIGIEEEGYEEFKQQGYFKHDLYVNRNKTIYKALEYKSIGFLNCFGRCTRNYWTRIKAVETKFDKITNDLTLKQDNFQMGGCLIINPAGNIIWQYMDSFFGDFAKDADILEAISDYYTKEGKAQIIIMDKVIN